MRPIAFTYGRVFVLVLVATAVTVSGTTAAVGSDIERTDTTTSALTESTADRLPVGDCDDSAVSDAEIDAQEENIVYGYVHGFENGRLEQWTDGSILQFGAYGDCTLTVRNETVRLTGAQVDASTGALRATIDLGRGGALALAPDDDSDVSIAIENVGYENNDTVRVVTTNATGSTDQFQLTAPSGRFFDLRLQFTEDGARLAISEIDFGYPAETDWEPIELASQNESWIVTLESRAYLDEIAVGDRQIDDESDESTATAPGDDSDDTEDEQSDDGFDRFERDQPDEYNPYEESADSSEGGAGLVFGLILALLGAGMFRFAYGLTRFSEQLDSFGSTTPGSDVEPAGWNVALTKLFGILVSIGGVIWFLSGLVTVL